MVNLLCTQSFLDVGAFDGYTSQEFIRINPGYKSVHVFEPEEKNMLICKDKFRGHKNIYFHQIGISNVSQTLSFEASGTASRISDKGEVEIRVKSLDELMIKDVTFIEMDIEGAE